MKVRGFAVAAFTAVLLGGVQGTVMEAEADERVSLTVPVAYTAVGVFS